MVRIKISNSWFRKVVHASHLGRIMVDTQQETYGSVFGLVKKPFNFSITLSPSMKTVSFEVGDDGVLLILLSLLLLILILFLLLLLLMLFYCYCQFYYIF